MELTLSIFLLYLSCIGNYYKSQSIFSQLQATCNKSFSSDHPMKVDMLICCGLMELTYSNLTVASQSFEKALNMAKVFYSKNHMKIAEVENYLGNLILNVISV